MNCLEACLCPPFIMIPKQLWSTVTPTTTKTTTSHQDLETRRLARNRQETTNRTQGNHQETYETALRLSTTLQPKAPTQASQDRVMTAAKVLALPPRKALHEQLRMLAVCAGVYPGARCSTEVHAAQVAAQAPQKLLLSIASSSPLLATRLPSPAPCPCDGSGR